MILKWIFDLNVKSKTIKLLGEKNRRKFLWTWIRQIIFSYISEGMIHEWKTNDKLHLIKIKNFCSLKDTVKWMRKQAID